MVTYRHWSVSLWWDPDDVPHCWVLSSDEAKWRLIIFALNRYYTAVPVEGNGDLQTLIYVLVARPRWCPTLSNPVSWQNWMLAYLGYTLRMKTLFHGWPVMVHHTHMRRRSICVSGLLAAYICSEVNMSDWQNGLTVSCIICDHWWHLKLVAFKWPVIILWWHRMAEPEHVRTLAECWVGQLNMCQLGQEVFVSLLLPAWLVWCAFVCNHCTGRASWTIVVYPPTGSTASVSDWAYTSSGVWPSFAFTVVYIMMVCRQG